MIPKSKTSELMDRLAVIFPDREPNEFELAQISREASRLLKSGVDPLGGHSLLGIIAAIQFQADDFLDHYRIAFDLSPERQVRINFALTARRLGLQTKAIEVVKDVYSKYPDDISILKEAHLQSVECLDWVLMRDSESRLEKLGVNLGGGLSSDSFKKSISLSKELNVGPEELLLRIEAASKIVREFREPMYGAVFDVSVDGMISYGIAAKVTPERALDISLKIAEHMVSDYQDSLADLITISCVTYRDAVRSSRVLESSEAVKQP